MSAIHRIVLICVITRCFYGGFVSDGKSVLGGFFRTLQAACSFYCVISAGSVFRTGTVIPFLDNMESFAGTILFCQICPLTVRPSPMPDETEQPDRKTACSADLRFRFTSCRRVYPPLSRRGAVRRLVPPEEYLSGFGTAHLIAARIEPGKRLRALCADAGQSEKQGRALLNEARCELDARLLALEEAWPDSRTAVPFLPVHASIVLREPVPDRRTSLACGPGKYARRSRRLASIWGGRLRNCSASSCAGASTGGYRNISR